MNRRFFMSKDPEKFEFYNKYRDLLKIAENAYRSGDMAKYRMIMNVIRETERKAYLTPSVPSKL